MNKPLPGTNITIFLLFFGIALLDAIQTHDWLRAVLWFALGLVFLWADLPWRHRIDERHPGSRTPSGDE